MQRTWGSNGSNHSCRARSIRNMGNHEEDTYASWTITVVTLVTALCITSLLSGALGSLTFLYALMLALVPAGALTQIFFYGLDDLRSAKRSPTRWIIGSGIWICGVTLLLTAALGKGIGSIVNNGWVIYAYLGAFVALYVAMNMAIRSGGIRRGPMSARQSVSQTQGVRATTFASPPPKRRFRFRFWSPGTPSQTPPQPGAKKPVDISTTREGRRVLEHLMKPKGPGREDP